MQIAVVIVVEDEKEVKEYRTNNNTKLLDQKCNPISIQSREDIDPVANLVTEDEGRKSGGETVYRGLEKGGGVDF
ncbi:hypothetical protein BG015_002632 [Linnemannia schmuckeri]|uniref:Uncharacterized protein n=1 Tax=Linnemannia schmuckeri TaxID=64567 RepID=A0A9P5V662_9FUNG|nr:hypothetical protein BG015_002632 [Linnemannia schmuckeri]